MGKKSGDDGKRKKAEVQPNFIPGWIGGRLTTPEAQKHAAVIMKRAIKARILARANESGLFPKHSDEDTPIFKI